jgi:hypothetical protein
MKKKHYDSHFAVPTDQSLLNTILGFGKASYTVFYVRAPLTHKVAKLLRDSPQPVQSPLTDEVKAIQKILNSQANTTIRPRLKQKELLGLMGVLMQFTSPVPKLQPYCETPWVDVDRLYQEIIKRGRKEPLGFADQLKIALKQTAGDLPDALWRLLITSRQYARWYDTEAIMGMPSFKEGEVIERMLIWSRSIKATKQFGSCPDQDTAGDTYYCWTHALAKVAFRSLAEKQSILTRMEARALERGTDLNHKLAHKVKPQGVVSDHTVAAAYGNAIGDVCVRLNQNTDT